MRGRKAVTWFALPLITLLRRKLLPTSLIKEKPSNGEPSFTLSLALLLLLSVFAFTDLLFLRPPPEGISGCVSSYYSSTSPAALKFIAFTSYLRVWSPSQRPQEDQLKFYFYTFVELVFPCLVPIRLCHCILHNYHSLCSFPSSSLLNVAICIFI